MVNGAFSGQDSGQDVGQNGGQFGGGQPQGPGTSFGHESPAADALDLGSQDRLPWLESADDVDQDDEGPDNGRLIALGVISLIVLAAIVGGVYWFTHREAPVAAADGSLIEASREPYKVAPKDPGGKTFQGTGDSSFKVSEGEHPAADLAAGTASNAPVAPLAAASEKPAEKNAAKPAAPAPSPVVSGVGVQVGAFSTQALAETGWSKLVVAHEELKGINHRVIAGKADIGTVYRLQAVPGDLASANALCSKLQAGGVKCQVKR